MKKEKTFFTKNNPNYVGEVVSDTPRADANNTLSINSDGYAQEVEVKIPQGEPTVIKVGGQKRMLASKKSTVKWYQYMWFSAIKLAVSAGSKIYANKQKAKMAMSDAQLLHAERQARGEEAYQGKLLEARQNDYKDEFVLVILSAPIIVLAWGVFSDNPVAMEKVKIFFEDFAALPTWFSTLWILVVGSIFGIKGTQIFRNGKK